MVWTTHWSLKASSLKRGPHCGNGEHSIHARDLGEGEKPLIARVQLERQPTDLWMTSSNIPPLLAGFYNLIPPSNLLHCSPSGQQGISLASNSSAATGLHWWQISQQWYKQMQQKTQIEIVIPKINNSFFHQEPHGPNHCLLSPLGWVSDHSSCSVCPCMI